MSPDQNDEIDFNLIAGLLTDYPLFQSLDLPNDHKKLIVEADIQRKKQAALTALASLEARSNNVIKKFIAQERQQLNGISDIGRETSHLRPKRY